jgi:hypothetical protein
MAADAPSPFGPDSRTRHVLTLDGGGVRGIVTLHMLAAFEQRYGVKACDAFDFFSGSSTGGIIAALLAFARMDARQILALYDEMISQIFVATLRSSKIGRLFTRRMYDRSPALEKLREVFGDARLGDLPDLRKPRPQALMLTTHDLVKNEEIFLSSYSFKTGKPNLYQHWKVRDAVAATALSAPWYFGPWDGRYIDGGATVFNTPAHQAAIEALDYCGEPRFERGRAAVWSFGSGDFDAKVAPGEADRWWPWTWAQHLLDDIQGDAESDQLFNCRRMDRSGEIEFRRFQVTIDPKTLAQAGIPPADAPKLPIALDRADAKDTLSRVGAAAASELLA